MFFGLAAERIDIAARALGCGTRAFEEARAYAAERHQFGKPLRALQAVSHRTRRCAAPSTPAAYWCCSRPPLRRGAGREGTRGGQRGLQRGVVDRQAVLRRANASACATRPCRSSAGSGTSRARRWRHVPGYTRVFRFGGGTDEIQRHIIQRHEFKRLRLRRGENRSRGGQCSCGRPRHDPGAGASATSSGPGSTSTSPRSSVPVSDADDPTGRRRASSGVGMATGATRRRMVGVHWPAEHGGRGATLAEYAMYLVTCAEAGAPEPVNTIGLEHGGSDPHRARHTRAARTASRILWPRRSGPSLQRARGRSDLGAIRNAGPAPAGGMA